MRLMRSRRGLRWRLWHSVDRRRREMVLLGGGGLRGAVRRAAGPLAQAPHVPGLREVEQRQDGEPDEAGEPGVGSYPLD